LGYHPARVNIESVPRDVIEIVPEPDPHKRRTVPVFEHQYAAMSAEQALQNNDQSLQRRSPGLPRWLALAVASGAIIALTFIYFLAQ